MTGEGRSYQQPCEGGMDGVDKQRAWGDVSERKQKISKTRLKQGQFRELLHVSKATVLEKTQTLSEVHVH